MCGNNRYYTTKPISVSGAGTTYITFEELPFVPSHFDAQLAISASGGTSPNLTVTLESSLDETNWTTIFAFAAKTGIAVERKAIDRSASVPMGRYQRAKLVTTGTNPTLTGTLILFPVN